MKQRTIKGKIRLSGIGLHTGQSVDVEILPAQANHGIVFKQAGIEEDAGVKADIRNVVSTQRATNLAKGDQTVNTVEHILSAFHGLGINNAEVRLTASELPIFDGSASHYTDQLSNIGTEELDLDQDEYVIERTESYKNEETGAEYTMMPSEKFEVTCFIDFESDNVPPQYAEYNSDQNFEKEVAPSRTFVFAEDLLSLKEQGLINGGSLSNALVIKKTDISDSKLQEIATHFDSEIKTAGHVLNAEGLRFNNELARHKILDFIGDLALLNVNVKGKFLIKKPGHKSNIEFLKELRKKVIKQKKLRGRPIYDPNVNPVMDSIQVSNMLPHKYPFLLVDKIITLTDTLVVGVKNVTMNENFFQGHFPGNPVFPGVLQMEALAQAGGILVLNQVEDPQNYDTYFLKMEGVKFKHMVRPGDTLVLKMELLSPVRRGLVHMMGTAYVGDKIASEGELTAQIVKRTS